MILAVASATSFRARQTTCARYRRSPRAGHYRKKAGTMKFIYGYVKADDGTRRNGWMAYEALAVSSGCP